MKPTDASPQGPIYTCPMHPEVRKVGPGKCPKCGMTLEPLQGRAETKVDGAWVTGSMLAMTPL